MAQVAARLMASRASAAAQPLPGGATITTAPVCVWGSQEEGPQAVKVIRIEICSVFPSSSGGGEV